MVMRLADALAALEVQESQRAVLQAELDELDALATFGELAGPMVHEFNNLLNVLLLQVAVLEHTLPEGAACRPGSDSPTGEKCGGPDQPVAALSEPAATRSSATRPE